ncbi:galactosyl transferase GMA12/MNN10 family protein [Arcticibacter tournemirensis]|uniref:Nucleotide-diphospho-sugar transferase domain-containing protein n=1 Tax=Arcticibacter tournemirensis TaxID=699437 RepID=A0A5M9HAK7_9SPHI|nr:hypothetical protein [Arcticibacter tournemirensis]KAA8482791.1 hypothetical protein F1649_11105 [Arcticibacter tournemirensis]TQM51092.1 galactosyl transferase GMA12/MNN10 family protein [Arcticibacter tournemirensis]
MSKVLVFSIAVGGYHKHFKSCIDTHRSYCQKYGYEYLLVDRAPRRLQGSEASWLKVPLMLQALRGDYEWVAFIDADCRFSDNMPPFDTCFNTLDPSRSIFMAPGISGRVNAGVIFLRNTAASIEFLETVIRNADAEVPSEDKAPYENGHIIHFSKGNPSLYKLEHLQWNNNSVLNTESYIQHYSGGELRKWYNENLAPVPQPAGFIKKGYILAGKVMRKISAYINRKKLTAPVSQRLADLLPFFKANYPVFNTVSNADTL